MTAIGDEFRAHHKELLETLTQHVDELERGTVDGPNLDSLLTLLTGDLLPHAVGEERHLYPVIDELIRRYGRPTAPMSIDHQRIEEYIGEIESAAEALRESPLDERVPLEARLRRLSRELRGLVRVHMEKEEKVFLPLIETYLSGPEQERVLRGLHHSYRDPQQTET